MLDQTQAAAPVLSEPNPAPALETPPPLAPRRRWLRRALPLLLLPALLFAIWLLALPAQAAVVLEYFNVVPSSSAVLLEWSTLSEYNLRGFEVLCKRDGEPEAAYHRIGFFNPKGNASQGAQYDMLVTDLQPGQAYCFRLEEVTTDDTPGEVRERCGYGLSLTPTPALRATVATTVTVGLTPTIVLFPTPTLPFGITPTLNPFATATPTLNPFAPTATPTLFGQQQSPLPTPLGLAPSDPALAAAQATIDPFATPTVDPFATPTLDPFATPTPDPFATATATVDPFATATPTVDPFATATWTPDPFAPTATATLDPLLAAATPTATLTPTLAITATATLTGAPLGQDAGGTGALVAVAPSPTPTSLFVVQTATPVPVPAAVLPAVTPWPTATPAPSLLAGMLTPTAQNITVMLLCFIFLSASVLGGLGLMTSVLWMRSRSQRDLDELRWRARRRI